MEILGNISSSNFIKNIINMTMKIPGNIYIRNITMKILGEIKKNTNSKAILTKISMKLCQFPKCVYTESIL